jgi:hypothetical protein
MWCYLRTPLALAWRVRPTACGLTRQDAEDDHYCSNWRAMTTRWIWFVPS